MANFGEEKGAHSKVQEFSYNTACLNDGETKKQPYTANEPTSIPDATKGLGSPGWTMAPRTPSMQVILT